MSQVQYSQISEKDHQAFMDLVVAQSHGNLSDAGAASAEMVQRRMRDLNRQWHALEEKVGFSVKSDWVMPRDQQAVAVEVTPPPSARLRPSF